MTNFSGVARNEVVGFSIGAYGYIGTGLDGSNYYQDFWEFTTSSVGIIENKTTSFIVYPNPSNGSFIVKSEHSKTIKEIQIRDLLGNVIIQQHSDDLASVNIMNVPVGIYLLAIVDQHNRTTYQKIEICH